MEHMCYLEKRVLEVSDLIWENEGKVRSWENDDDGDDDDDDEVDHDRSD